MIDSLTIQFQIEYQNHFLPIRRKLVRQGDNLASYLETKVKVLGTELELPGDE